MHYTFSSATLISDRHERGPASWSEQVLSTRPFRGFGFFASAENAAGFTAAAWQKKGRSGYTTHVVTALSGMPFASSLAFPAALYGGPMVAVNAHGDVLVADHAPQGGIVAAYRRSGARGFEASVRLAGVRGIPLPQIALAQTGGAVAAWTLQPDSSLPYRGSGLWVAVRRAGARFGPALVLARGVTAWQLASNVRGDALLVWRRGSGIYAQTLISGQPAFGVPQRLSNSVGGTPYASVGSGDGMVVAWQGAGDGTVRAATAPNAGVRFGPPRLLTSTAPKSFVHTVFASNANGDVAIAWLARSTTGQLIVQGSTRAAHGSFTASERWSLPNRHSQGISLALTANGTVTAAWYEAYQGGPLDAASRRAGTRFAHPYAIAPQTCDTNGTYEGQTPLEPIAPGRILILAGDCSQPTAEGTDAVIGTGTSFSPPTLVFPSTPPYGTTIASDGRGQAMLASVNGV